MERGWPKAHVEISPTCPRCGSSNTKFCYYNNYSLTQPRYFCKGCRRYWTKGGSLRNIPVGGGCRKARRGKVVRISMHGLSSRISSIYGDSRAMTNGHFIAESSSSNPAPNIDLAVVYANYLNQQPSLDETKQHEMPILMPNANIHVDTGNKLLPENCFNECATGFSDWSMDIHSSKNLLHVCGIEEAIGHDDKYQNIVSTGTSNHDLISNYDQLLPLPGEEMGIWSSFQTNIVSDVTDDQTLHGAQVMLGFEAEADNEELMGNRSMFDHLSNYGTHTSRTRP